MYIKALGDVLCLVKGILCTYYYRKIKLLLNFYGRRGKLTYYCINIRCRGCNAIEEAYRKFVSLFQTEANLIISCVSL